MFFASVQPCLVNKGLIFMHHALHVLDAIVSKDICKTRN